MSSEALIFPISHFLKDLSHSAVGQSVMFSDFLANSAITSNFLLCIPPGRQAYCQYLVISELEKDQS